MNSCVCAWLLLLTSWCLLLALPRSHATPLATRGIRVPRSATEGEEDTKKFVPYTYIIEYARTDNDETKDARKRVTSTSQSSHEPRLVSEDVTKKVAVFVEEGYDRGAYDHRGYDKESKGWDDYLEYDHRSHGGEVASDNDSGTTTLRHDPLAKGTRHSRRAKVKVPRKKVARHSLRLAKEPQRRPRLPALFLLPPPPPRGAPHPPKEVRKGHAGRELRPWHSEGGLRKRENQVTSPTAPLPAELRGQISDDIIDYVTNADPNDVSKPWYAIVTHSATGEPHGTMASHDPSTSLHNTRSTPIHDLRSTSLQDPISAPTHDLKSASLHDPRSATILDREPCLSGHRVTAHVNLDGWKPRRGPPKWYQDDAPFLGPLKGQVDELREAVFEPILRHALCE